MTEHRLHRFTVHEHSPKCVFSCHSVGYFLWQQVVNVAAVIEAFVAPFAVTFREREESGEVYVGLVVDAVFLTDVAVNFNLSYIREDGEEVNTRRDIAYHYLKTSLKIDVLPAIPWTFLALICPEPAFTPLLLLSLLRLVRLFTRGSLGVESKVRQVCKLGLWLTLLTHWCACFWYSVVSPSETWHPSSDVLSKTDIYTQSTLNRYFLFLYYAAITLVQGGELFPVRDLDTALITFLELLGVVAFTMIFSKVSLLVQQSDTASSRFLSKLEAVETASLELGLPATLHRKLLSAIGQQAVSFQLESFALIQSLSESLFKDVLEELLVSVPSLSALGDFFHPRVQEKLLRLLNPVVCVPEEVLFREFQPGDSLYFLYRGSISCTIHSLNIHKPHVEVGGMFGTAGTSSYSHTHCYTATVVQSSLLFALSRESVTGLNELAPRLAMHLKMEMMEECEFWMKRIQEKVRVVPYLSDLSVYEMLEVALVVKPAVFEKDTCIVQKGQNLAWVVVVVDGSVEVQTHGNRTASRTQSCTLLTLGPGSVYGLYSAAKATNIQHFDLVASENCTCLLLPQDSLSALAQHIPKLGRFNISLYDAKKDDFLSPFLYRSPWQRVKIGVIRILQGYLQKNKVTSLALGESLIQHVKVPKRVWKRLKEIAKMQENLLNRVNAVISQQEQGR